MDITDKPDEDEFFLEMNEDEEKAEEESSLIDDTDAESDSGLDEVGDGQVEEFENEMDESTFVDTDSQSGETDDAINNELEAVKAERDKYKDQLMRKAADLDNYRKRVAREKEDQRKYGNEKFAAELLPVVDNMERALAAIHSDETNASITDGVEMVYKQLLAALKRFGVEGFKSKNTLFDPQKHEAIQQVETDDVENGIIIDEFQKGYFINDRLLRPAMVSVAKNSGH